MTVEELDIVVQASVEQALTEFKKIVPQLKRTIKQVEYSLNNVDAKGMTNKVQQATKEVKKKINEIKGTSLNIENEEAKKKIEEIQKYITKLEKQINEKQLKLNVTNQTLDSKRNSTFEEVTNEIPDAGRKRIKQETYNRLDQDTEYSSLIKESDRLNQSIMKYNSLLETSKAQLGELQQEYSQIAEQIQQTTTKQSIWSNAVNKVRTAIAGIKKNMSSSGGTFENVANMSEKVRNGCNQILKVTGRIVTKVKQIGTGFKQGLRHILRYAGALLSLQTIYSALSGSANAWLSSQNAGAQKLQANIDYLKTSFGSILAPVIEYVVNLVYQLMKAIQSLVYALSGVNIFANASAKAYESMASSAKEANKQTKQLAGVHSEINNISSNDSSSSGSGGSTTPSFDLSQIDSQMSPLAQKLYNFFKPLVDSWKTYGAGLVEQVKQTAGQIGELLSSVWGSFEKIITNGTVYSVLENILVIIGNIAQAWSNAWNYNNNGDAIIQNLANAFNKLLKAINNVVRSQEFQKWLNNCSDKFREISEKIASIDWKPLIDALSKIGQSIGSLALEILSGLVSVFKWFIENPNVAEIILGIAIAITTMSTVMGVLSGVMTTLTAVSSALNISLLLLTGIITAIIAVIALIVVAIMNWDTIMQTLNNTFENVISFITNSITTLYNEHIKPLIDNIVNLLQTLWNSILKPLIDWLVANVLPVLVPIFESLWNTFSSVVGSITDAINGVIETFKGVIEFIAGVFSGDWEKAWQGICDFFSGIWNTIKSIIKIVWNAISGIIKTAVYTIKGVITTVFNAIKTVITNIWNGIWNTIKKVINSILGGIESMANGVVNGVNAVIRVLNNLSFEIPDWVPVFGGKTFGFNIPLLGQISLPRLAKGAVLTVPTVAEMAEYPGASTNPEIVTPQNIMEETFDKVLARYQGNDNSQPINLAVYVGNAKLGQILLDDLRNMKRRSGKDIEALVGG